MTADPPPEAGGAMDERLESEASHQGARCSIRSDPGPQRDEASHKRARVSTRTDPGPQQDEASHRSKRGPTRTDPGPEQDDLSESFKDPEKPRPSVCTFADMWDMRDGLYHECPEMTVAGFQGRWSLRTRSDLMKEAMDPHKVTETPGTCRSWLRLIVGMDHSHNLNVHVKVHAIRDVLIIALGGSFGYVLWMLVHASGVDYDEQKEVIDFVCYLGVLFIRFLRLLVQPLTFTAIATGVAAMVSHNSKRTMRIVLIFIAAASLLSVGLGLLLGLQLKPGEVKPSKYLLRKAYGNAAAAALAGNSTARLEVVEENLMEVGDSVHAMVGDTERKPNLQLGEQRKSTLYHVMIILDKAVPDNIAVAMAENNMLGLALFSALFGVAACSLENDQMLRFLENLNQCIISMIPYRLQPFAVFFLVAKVIATNATDFSNVMTALAKFSGTVVLGLGIQATVVLPLMYWATTRRNPYKWIKDMEAALFVAFCTCSSAAALPYTLHAVGTNWPRTSTARLVLPLGMQLNMNGTALYMTLVVVYIAQVTGQPLDVERCILIAIFVMMASLTTAAIPGGSLISVVYVLRACAPHEAGMEDRWLESIALVVPVDKFLDMLRTVVNVLGDTVACAVVDHYRTRNGLSTGRSKSLEGFDLEAIEARNSDSHCHRQGEGRQEHKGREHEDEAAADVMGESNTHASV